MSFWWVAFWIGSIALSAFAMKAPKVETPKPAGLQDFDVPKAEDGALIPVVFGTKTVNAPNVLWYGDLDVEPIRVSGSKK